MLDEEELEESLFEIIETHLKIKPESLFEIIETHLKIKPEK